MDWINNNNNIEFVSPQSSSASTFLYNYNYSYTNLDHFPPPVLETTSSKKLAAAREEGEQGEVVGGGGGVDLHQKKKQRLNQDQLESLERSFQEEVKLDPDRKMKLSMELGLQPRQIAVWFQNRRARWKAKQLEHLYDSLKQQFDTISKEKLNLQQEVMKLRSILREQAARNQGSTMGYTDVSGEETVESTSVGVRSCNNYIYNNVEDFNKISASAPPFWWGDLPSYP